MSALTFEQLQESIARRLNNTGLSTEHSGIIAHYFATVEFYGVSSHGVRTLGSHIDRIARGGYNLRPVFEVEKEMAGFAVVNGENAIGMLSGNFCVEYAMKKAAESGMFTVFSHNNNTYGASFYYALKAAKAGFICITSSNSPAQMAPMGGRDKMLGTNPFAIAIPAKKEHPIVVDMATSAVAKSKLNEYKERGIPLPVGWALNENGEPTTDPEEALRGLMLPMAGFKGYGISMMIDIIGGVLSGASYLSSVGRFYSPENKPMDVGFNFTVIDPRAVYGEKFYDEMDEYISILRSSRPANDGGICLPGDDRLGIYCKNLANGWDDQNE